jgi:hypothetical protein
MPARLLTLLLFLPVAAKCELSVGQVYPITFVDVDGNTLSTAEGRVTTIVVTPESNVDRARAVGDRIPNLCLANPDYRMITVVAFQKKHSKPVRMVLAALIRRRLDGEAQRLQVRYDQLKIAGNARRDVRAVADFDGTVISQFGLPVAAGNFRVFVFGRNGQLVRQWSELPSSEELAAALK